MLERLDHLRDELVHIETQLGDPAVSSDPRRLVELGRRHHELQPVVTAAADLDAAREDLDLAEEMIRQSDGDERTGWRELRDGAAARVLELEESLRALLLPKDPNNDRNVIVEIRGAEGGEEANLFARVLYDMYRSYASSMGWQVEVLGAQPSDLGGFSDVAMLVKGDGAWSALKHEAGPHRVQRVPVTESQGRIHTSSAAVNVLPEADEVDVFIDPNDLQVDVFRSSGPGGQSVNTTDSAVRITHRPTGLVVSMQDEKSQLQNRDKAMRVLRSRLLQLEQDRVTAEHAAAKRDQVGRGGRSEKIRTYNFKENRVTDHRIGLTLYKLDQILGGELDELVDALRQDERRRQLEGSAP